jgi:hypothetical protein
MSRGTAWHPTGQQLEKTPVTLEWGYQVVPIPSLTEAKLILLMSEPSEPILIQRKINMKLV